MQIDRNSFAAALAQARGYVVIAPDIALLLLMRKNVITGECALVSSCDAQRGRFYWSKNRWGYPRRRTPDGGSILLHREIMGCVPGDGLVVDHINRDKLDCRRENLRFLTQAENAQNQGGRNLSTSRHRGVSYQSRTRKWVVHHGLNGKQCFAGAFATEDEAAAAARAWRDEHMPYAGDSSKHRGVSWDKSRDKWKAQARIPGGTNVCIGRFDSEQEAADVARAWRLEHMPAAVD